MHLLLTAILLLSSSFLLSFTVATAADPSPPSPPPLHLDLGFAESQSPFHTPPAITSFTGDEHPSHNPSVVTRHRTRVERREDMKRDADMYDQLLARNLVDIDANPIGAAAAVNSVHEDDTTTSFLEQASATLAHVMQHNSHAIYHYKSLLTRAKSALEQTDYDTAATLYKEASDYYFDWVRKPYAMIDTYAALSKTMQKELSKEFEMERMEKYGGSSESDSPNAASHRPQTVSQQFREQELANRPHVHTALLEFKKGLDKKPASKKPKADKKK